MAKQTVIRTSKDSQEYDQNKAGQKSRENQQILLYMFISFVVILAWIIGYFQFSFLWVFLLILLTLLVWWNKVISLIEAYVRDKEVEVHRKRALRKSETAEWMNFLVNRWWIFSSGTISDLIKRKLDPLLSDIKPSFLSHIELASFTLGEKTPFIKSVHVYEYVDVGLAGKKMMSWASIVQSAAGLVRAQQHHIIIEADVGLVGEDFAMVFHAKVGGKRAGMVTDIAVEKLNISGKMQFIVHLDMDMTFPHISAITFSFTEKPQIWFSVRVLKMLPVMDMPGLKSWIHWLVMDALTEAMVDPGKVNIRFDRLGPSNIPSKSSALTNALGVLTVTVKGEENMDVKLIEDFHYCELIIGDQHKQTHYVRTARTWEDHCSFLVYDLKKDTLQIRCKTKVLVTTHTVAEFVVLLADFPFESSSVFTTTLQAECPKTNEPVKIELELEYTALTPINTIINKPLPTISEVSGVMCVCIHSARNLLGLDQNGLSDPYCVLYNNGKKVKSTHYVRCTKNPEWNFNIEFTVADFTKTMLSFIVCDWDGHSASEDDLLGSAHAILKKDEPMLVRTELMLGFNAVNVTQTDLSKLGSIIVSIVFRPVSSVAKSERKDAVFDNPDESLNARAKRRTAAFDETATDILGYNLLEMHVIRARNLVAKDSNGFSDPYVVVLINEERKYKSSVKKKTLDPFWNEQVTLPLLGPDDSLKVTVWDKDSFFCKDFLGSLVFTLDDLKKYNNNNKHDGWFELTGIEKGELQLKFSFPLDDLSTTSDSVQMVDVATSTSFISGSPDSGIPSSSPGTPRQMNVFNFPKQGKQSEAANDVLDQVTNVTVRERSLSLPGNGIDEIPVVKHDQIVNSSPAKDFSQKSGHSRSTSMPPTKGASKTGMARSEQRGPMILTEDKPYAPPEFYHVQGQILRIKGLEDREQELYVKVRLDRRLPGKSGGIVVIAKSAKVKAMTAVIINLKFDVDLGVGMRKDAFLVFDIKKSRKSHIAVQSFTLQEIFEESDRVTKWLHLDSSIEMEVTMRHTPIPLPKTHKSQSTFSGYKTNRKMMQT
ncbi:hypothetical protein LSH36_167g03038 [Paralvinella palmiformis]|uniref:Uncharacterized protein n=1 Tax=Paralvinella palmiformis TaxID=53620 RepID=A0AAD9N852_9ANNE|nr:hypothetical protein LSH36_167g03038 [Paralvinella palmiformis]